MKEETYRVTIELEVTATSKEQALKYAVDDINELYQNESLDAKIQIVNEDPIETSEKGMQMVQVIFGGSMGIYVDGKLEIYRKQMDYNDILVYLLESIHKNFEPIQTIRISDCSTYWDKQKRNHFEWTPESDLETLKSKLDLNYDQIY